MSYRNRDNAFKYSLGANIAFVSTNVVSLGEGGDPITTGNVFSAGAAARTEVGHPIASFYGYVTDGLFQNRQEIEAHAFQTHCLVHRDKCSTRRDRNVGEILDAPMFAPWRSDRDVRKSTGSVVGKKRA